MNEADQEFLHDMVKQLDDTIRQLAIEESQLMGKIGAGRVEELLEYWRLELSAEEEVEFKKSMDYWDIQLIRILSRSKRAHNTRVEVGQTLMKMASRPILKRKPS
ncbi:MAG: hypothetical protein CTY16_13570 [Methylobacter sp.]|uniref:Uncharacterized protein n=1 Tax=Methylovulum miyakonense TaxID=645578 RepID=E1CBY0_9GAMM|nr:hypothetical protein [Methylovulum miyakonense]PPD43325.1 MAG: hypothetical protein CTY16_13570 [Methylobacter sp.]BAJ17651.1 hypothetical protein [Methylovulum miyakonense HT12]